MPASWAFSSGNGGRGVSESVLDGILNHKQSATRGGVLGVYQVSSQTDARRLAMEAWSRYLDNAPTAANVVEMRSA